LTGFDKQINILNDVIGSGGMQGFISRCLHLSVMI
jgi:hypothetical protein